MFALALKRLLLLALACCGASVSASAPSKYATVLGMSLDFYDAQRSGRLPSDNRIKWRADSLVSDKTPAGTDLSGGWFDAGDNVKFQLPGAWTASMLAWGMLQFGDGYKRAGHYERALATIRWASDFFIKSAYAPDRLVGQVGNGAADHAMWVRPEDVPGPSPVYVLDPSRPGSDVAGTMAAALAQASILFGPSDPAYAAKCLAFARRIYAFGARHQGKYSDSIADAASFYPSSNFRDDLAWGAVWLFKATGSPAYLAQATAFMGEHVALDGTPWANVDWDNQYWTTALMLGRLGVKPYASVPPRFVEAWLEGKHGVRLTPKGLAWAGPWGALRHTSNAIFYLLSHARGAQDEALRQRIVCFARRQVAYMLGEATGQSFVVGYGTNFPRQPHHRAASCSNASCGWAAFHSPLPNPNVVRGALVGGPGPDDSYLDARHNYVQNEVAIDYSAGFTGVMAALLASGAGGSPKPNGCA
ncbi:endo-beta-1,4-glucanase [Scenedesmus sp. NREL 46B-D3]|nr:endo-beta-1,4-glucanase [Scenedesmus sp. NREL 46B-D3]